MGVMTWERGGMWGGGGGGRLRQGEGEGEGEEMPRVRCIAGTQLRIQMHEFTCF